MVRRVVMVKNGCEAVVDLMKLCIAALKRGLVPPNDLTDSNSSNI